MNCQNIKSIPEFHIFIFFFFSIRSRVKDIMCELYIHHPCSAEMEIIDICFDVFGSLLLFIFYLS